MKDQEIVDNAPVWADTHRKLLDYPDLTTYVDNGRDDKLDRSLADIKRIVDLEANQERAEKLISELHEQVYDSEYLDNQVELYEALKEPKQ
jgi:hypothetical protein